MNMASSTIKNDTVGAQAITFTTTTPGIGNIFGNGVKHGDMCNVSFYYSGSTNTSTAIGKLSIAPKARTYISGNLVLSDNSVKVCPFVIETTGEVYQQGSNATISFGAFNGSYIC